ncbi:MAG: hypothetical protein ACRC8S_07455 [Fimbriiglobus sp.]
MTLMRFGWFLLTLAMLGCGGPNGPATTNTLSSTMPKLADRVEFLERYVTFRRGYDDLHFHIAYQNNISGVPGPSDWDVRLMATVPAAELDSWVPEGVVASATADTVWLRSVPGSLSASGIREWYTSARLIVGIDRERRLVVYRRWSN